MDISNNIKSSIHEILSKEDIEAKKQVKLDLERKRGQLLFREPFITKTTMRLGLVPVVDLRMPTAATDGKTIFVNPYFWTLLSNAEQLFLLAHEIWHVLLLHFYRLGSKDRHLWNLATDHEINSMLNENNYTMIKNSVYFEWLDSGASAEKAYKELSSAFSGGNKEDPLELFGKPNKSKITDVHISDGTPQLSPNTQDDDEDDQKNSKYRRAFQSIESKIDPEYNPSFDIKDMDAWKEDLVKSYQLFQGNQVPSALSRMIEPLIKPVKDWRYILKNYLGQLSHRESKWLPPNKRYAYRGLYLPSRQQNYDLQAVIAVDTSGSTEDYLRDFLAEMNAIFRLFNRYQIRLIYCDTEIHYDKTYCSPKKIPVRHVFRGFGGTSFVPVFKAIESEKNNIDALLYFTDGYGTAPDLAPLYPVIWILTENGRRPAPYGKVINL